MSTWYLQPIAGSYLLVGLLLIALVALISVRPSFHTATKKRQAILAGLRGAIVFFIALMLLRPTLISTSMQVQKSLLVVMFDTSKSMTVPDESDGSTRYEAQQKSLDQLQRELSSLDQNLEVAVYQFDQAAKRIELESSQFQVPEIPEGRFTDIGSSLSQVMQGNLGKRLAAVVLLSDGAQRVYSPKVELQQAARDLQRQGTPLHTIPYGKALDPSQARDVAVENLPDSYSVFVKNEMKIRATVRVQGFASLPIPVQLRVEDENGKMSVVETKQISSSEAIETQEVIFRYTPKTPGQFKLSVTIPPMDGELVTRNNELSAFLNVLDGGLRILYLEGRTIDRYEQRFIRSTIASSADMDMDFMWIDQRRRRDWPVDLTKEIREGKYDVFLIGDLDSSALSEKTSELIAKQVEDGKGLMMLGGFHAFGAGSYQQTVFKNVLPVFMSRFDRQDFDGPIREDMHIQGPIRIKASTSHFLTNLGVHASGRSALVELPSLTGANKIESVKRKAKVMLESETGSPLLVAGEYGLGRTLAFMVDSTWRWVMSGEGETHRRFWRQNILWLAKKDQLQNQDVWVQLDQRRYVPGATVQFAAGARSPSGEPLRGVTYEAQLVSPTGEKLPVRTLPAENTIGGEVQLSENVGDYSIVVTAKQEGAVVGTGRGRFFVFDQDLELADPSARPSQLAALSAITASAGGKTWSPESISDLIQEIKQRPTESEVEIQTKWTWPESNRDSWINLLMIAGLLSAEWYLRKQWGMV